MTVDRKADNTFLLASGKNDHFGSGDFSQFESDDFAHRPAL
jgi:hypothetical protein